MKSRMLFLVNGLGLGNSTRCHAIIQKLKEAGAVVGVITSGNGLWYFEDCEDIDQLHSIEQFRYVSKDGRISILKTLWAVPEFLQIAVQNEKKIQRVLDTFNPDVAVIDSVYTTKVLRQNRIPVIAINNADNVVSGMIRFRNFPWSVVLQFIFIEFFDYLFHRFIPNITISPGLDTVDGNGTKNYFNVGPIVRTGYGVCESKKGTPIKVTIMLSGSVFGSPVALKKHHANVRFDVLGRPQESETDDFNNVIVSHGKIKNTYDILKHSDIVIVNGGFSAVSEIFCMRKPLVVIPVPNHAEQWINARMIEHLGVGMIGNEDALDESITKALEKLENFKDGYKKIANPAGGAKTAAEKILQQASRKYVK